MSVNLHPFDRAIALQALGEHRVQGRPDAAYANMVGPFGGITAATLLSAAPLLLTGCFSGSFLGFLATVAVLAASSSGWRTDP